MRKISTGEPSTLGTYRQIALIMGGGESKATEFIDLKIKESSKGADEEVIAEESQMLMLLAHLVRNTKQKETTPTLDKQTDRLLTQVQKIEDELRMSDNHFPELDVVFKELKEGLIALGNSNTNIDQEGN